jgi:HEAT repeat protein
MAFGGVKPVAALAVGAILAAGAAIAVAFLSTETEVTGETPQERVASVRRQAKRASAGQAGAIVAAAGDPSPAVRRAAVVALGNLPDPRHRTAIEARLKDDDASVRSAAAAALGAYTDAAAAARLGTLLGEDPSEKVQMGAVVGLGRQVDAAAVVHLVEAMETGRTPRVRQRAFLVLTARLKVHFLDPPDPRDAAGWADLLRRVRSIRGVQKARQGAAATTQGRQRP